MEVSCLPLFCFIYKLKDAGWILSFSNTTAEVGSFITVTLDHSNSTFRVIGLLLYATRLPVGQRDGFFLSFDPGKFAYKSCGGKTTQNTLNHKFLQPAPQSLPLTFNYKLPNNPTDAQEIEFSVVVAIEAPIVQYNYFVLNPKKITATGAALQPPSPSPAPSPTPSPDPIGKGNANAIQVSYFLILIVACFFL